MRAWWILLAVTVSYAALSAGLILSRPQHYEMALLAIQYAVFLIAVLYYLRSSRAPAGRATPYPSPKMLAAAFLLAAIPLSWFAAQGLLIPDESAYRFQSKVFLLGRLTAGAPSGAAAVPSATPKEIYFEHHIVEGSRWFVKYPWGWPAVLALGTWFRSEYLVNPLLGLLLLGLIWKIAKPLFGKEAAALALFLAVLSPFFLANCIGLMSHVLTGILVAAACLLCFRGFKSRTVAPFAAMFALLGLACQVRPFTGAVMAMVLGLASLWYLRGNRRLFLRVTAAGAAFGALTVASVLLYNKLYTGSPWLSPYALAVGAETPREVTLSPLAIVRNAFVSRWAFQQTMVFMFPFLPLLAGFAVWRERAHAREASILVALFPALVLAHLVQTEMSASFNGERYYFEGFFALAILGARGMALLFERWSVPYRAAFALLTVLAGLQVTAQTAASHIIFSRSYPYRQVRAAAENFRGRKLVIFMTQSPDFTPKHFNLNRADWERAGRVYLIDPGPAERAEWAARFKRLEWVVIGYDRATRSATLVRPGRTNLASSH